MTKHLIITTPAHPEWEPAYMTNRRPSAIRAYLAAVAERDPGLTEADLVIVGPEACGPTTCEAL